jgi:hypothetical protein
MIFQLHPLYNWLSSSHQFFLGWTRMHDDAGSKLSHECYATTASKILSCESQETWDQKTPATYYLLRSSGHNRAINLVLGMEGIWNSPRSAVHPWSVVPPIDRWWDRCTLPPLQGSSAKQFPTATALGASPVLRLILGRSFAPSYPWSFGCRCAVHGPIRGHWCSCTVNVLLH